MDTINIRNLEIFACHGVFPEENTLGQKFLVSVSLHTDTRRAGMTDDLSDSIHYGEVCQFIKLFLESRTYKLLERAAEMLAQELLLAWPLIRSLDLEIQKPWAPIGLPLETVSVRITRGRHLAAIALGSNLGDKKAALDFAVNRLGKNPCCKVLKVADYIMTEPYGNVEQDNFLNSALLLETLLPPADLLSFLHEIEQEAHRERRVRWGPRTLDLDILLYDDLILDTPDLHIPHIDMHNRDFVLTPLAQIAPYLRHPILHRTIAELRDALKEKS